MIGAVAIQFMSAAGGFYRVFDAFNSTVYNMNDATLTTQWDKHYGFLTAAYWLVPLIFVTGMIILLWAIAQRREYYTTGGIIG
jgi:hypothetical protein